MTVVSICKYLSNSEENKSLATTATPFKPVTSQISSYANLYCHIKLRQRNIISTYSKITICDNSA
jgi:hypothetical protein